MKKKKRMPIKKVIKHLKGDIKTFHKEAREDRELIKKLHSRDKKKPSKKKVTVAKGVKVAHGAEEKMRSKKGSSSAGKYKTVSPKDFAGASGGASKYSFPINTLARARNALARAHYAPDPEGIKRKVYAKYPELRKIKQKREHHAIIV
jgi:hypothetical protein